MLSQPLHTALNDQIKHEMNSAYLYLSMSAYFETQNFSGFAHWMHVQYEEEMSHAMKFFEFINDRGGRVYLQALDQPQAEFGSPLEVFEEALANEKEVTATINRLYDLAIKENDYPTQVLLQWFVMEQVEEEKSAGEIVELLKLSGGQGAALIMLDRQLAARRHE